MAVISHRLLFFVRNTFSISKIAWRRTSNVLLNASTRNSFHGRSALRVVYRNRSEMPKRAAAKVAEEKKEVAEKPKRAARAKKAKEEQPVKELEKEEEAQEKTKKRVAKAKPAAAAKEKPEEKPTRGRAKVEKEKPAAKPKAKKAAAADTKENVTRSKRQPKAKENLDAVEDVESSDEENVESQEEEKKPRRAPKKKSPPTETVEEVEEQPKGKRGKKANEEDKKAAKPTNKTDTDYEAVSFDCKQKNAKGEEYNLKISSWNVGGLRSWLKKGGPEFLQKEDPNILCIQETKCSDDKIPDELKTIEGYHTYWCSSKKEGYAGVGVLTKAEPLDVKYGIGQKDHDEEGRCITAEFENFILVNAYVPNAGRKLVTLPKRLEWNAAFKAYIKELDKKKPVILCGDMNVAHEEIDLANPKTNTKNAGFTKEEREGMTDFLADGYVDTFRKLYPDRKDAYTFWSYMNNARAKNVGWRLDYFIVSDKIMDQVCDNQIRHEVYGSDHCPLTMFVRI